MKTLPHDYKTEVMRADIRSRLCSLSLDPKGISPYLDGSLHCVESTVEKSSRGDYVLRLRVITNSHGSVRITVPINSDYDYQRFLILRFNIRNSDAVFITVDDLEVRLSPNGFHELYLFAKDYTVISGDLLDDGKHEDEDDFDLED